MKKTKKILAVLLSMAMVLSLFSGIAFAAEVGGEVGDGDGFGGNPVVDGTNADTTTEKEHTGLYYLEGVATGKVSKTFTYDCATSTSNENFVLILETNTEEVYANGSVDLDDVITIEDMNSDEDGDDVDSTAEITAEAGRDSSGHFGVIFSIDEDADIGTYEAIFQITIELVEGRKTTQTISVFFVVTCNGDNSHNTKTVSVAATCEKGGYEVTYCEDETYSGDTKALTESENEYGLYEPTNSSNTYVKVGDSYYRVLTSKTTEATGHTYTTSYEFVYTLNCAIQTVTTKIISENNSSSNKGTYGSSISTVSDTITVTDSQLTQMLSDGDIDIVTYDGDGDGNVEAYIYFNNAELSKSDFTSLGIDAVSYTESNYISYYLVNDENSVVSDSGGNVLGVELCGYTYVVQTCTCKSCSTCNCKDVKNVGDQSTIVKYLGNNSNLTCQGVYYYFESVYYNTNDDDDDDGYVYYTESFMISDSSEGNHDWDEDNVTLTSDPTPTGTTTEYVLYDDYWMSVDDGGTIHFYILGYQYTGTETLDVLCDENGTVIYEVSEDVAVSYTYEINNYDYVYVDLTCAYGCGTTVSREATVKIIAENIVAPTCDENGSVTYVATYDGADGTEYTVKWTETIEAVGHDYYWEEWSGISAYDEDGDSVLEYQTSGTALISDFDAVSSLYKYITLYCSNTGCEGEDGETTPESISIAVDGELVEDSYEAATCDEAGSAVYYFEYTYNGTTYSMYETVEIAALGHDYNVIGTEWIVNSTTGYVYGAILTYVCENDCCENETWQKAVPANYYTVDPTCTEDGAIYVFAYVTDAKTFEYDEDNTNNAVVLVEEIYEVLEATGHNYKSYVSNDGLTVTYECITCGDTYIEVALNGLYYDSESGNWYYYVANEVDTDYTGFASNSLGEWYVKEGVVQFVTGLYYINGTWYYLTNGLLASDYTGFATNSAGTWYVESGVVDFGYTGLATVDGTRYYIYKNLVSTATGLYRVNGTWYYFVNGAIASDYTGFAANAYGTWYVVDGVVDFSVKGLVTVDGATYYVAGNKLITNTGLYYISGTWYYFVEGMVASYYTGLASNAGYSWYVENGIVDFTYTGTYESGNYTYNIVSSRVVSYTYTVVY